MGRRLRRLEPAPAAGVGRRGGSARPRAARGGSPRSGTAQHGSGGAVGAPMRRRTGWSLPDPCPAAPNRSGDGAPAPVHGSLRNTTVSRPSEARPPICWHVSPVDAIAARVAETQPYSARSRRPDRAQVLQDAERPRAQLARLCLGGDLIRDLLRTGACYTAQHLAERDVV